MNRRTTQYLGFLVVALLLVVTDLSPLRQSTRDEIIIADGGYAIASGESRVPTQKLWEHIIPGFGIVNFNHPPLYPYLESLSFRIFGFSPVSVALLHLGLRGLTGFLILALLGRLASPPRLSLALAAIWMGLCHGPLGRPEDLALLLAVAGILCIAGRGESRTAWPLAGVLAGLAFLAYPVSLFLTIPLGVTLAFVLPGSRRRSVPVFVLCGAIAASLWLAWIIPFWPAFREVFLRFTVPDAASPNFFSSGRELVERALLGRPGCTRLVECVMGLSQSSWGVLAVFAAFLGLCWSKRQARLLLIPIVAYALLTSRNRVHDYALVWLDAGLLLAAAVLSSPGLGCDERARGRRLWLTYALLLAGAQVLGRGGLALLQGSGNWVARARLGAHPYAALLERIPPGQKVLTSDPYVFYALRATNPIRWPAGFRGVTPGRYRFSARYDESFRWLVTPGAIESGFDPGGKFGWNDETATGFRAGFARASSQRLWGPEPRCWICRFSTLPSELFLYSRRGGAESLGP